MKRLNLRPQACAAWYHDLCVVHVVGANYPDLAGVLLNCVRGMRCNQLRDEGNGKEKNAMLEDQEVSNLYLSYVANHCSKIATS